MNYAIAIEHELGKAYGVEVPDLPGCFSAGDTLDEAISNAAEAIAFHIEGLPDDGGKIPSPQGVEAHSANPDYAGRIRARFRGPRDPLREIEAPEHLAARARHSPHRLRRRENGETRSGFCKNRAGGEVRENTDLY
ncbi:MAG: type II toxin-antitoxin system HicB family antitoxin [Thermomicrobiales bacterium]